MRRGSLAAAVAAALLMGAGWSVSAKAAVVSGSIVLNQAAPTFGDTVTFTWSCSGCPNAPKSAPRIQVLCYQNDVIVFGMAAPADDSFLLGGSMSQWLINGGGPAACHADLYFWSYKGSQQFNRAASTDFPVN